MLIPGDPERTKRAEVKIGGVSLGDAIVDQLKTISGQLSVAWPASLGEEGR